MSDEQEEQQTNWQQTPEAYENKSNIIGLLNNTDFLEDVKKKLLGLRPDIIKKCFVPIAPRILEEGSLERIDGYTNIEIMNPETKEPEIKRVPYINDAALMNDVGANEITAMINLLSNPIAKLGNINEEIMLRQQRVSLIEIGFMIINNRDRYGIRDANIGAVQTQIGQLILPLFTHSLTNNPKSLIESLTGLYQEVRQSKESQGEPKKRGLFG